MNSFQAKFLSGLEIPVGTSWLLGTCMEARGKQDLWLQTKAETLEALRELAIIQSAESSNRIEGVTVDKERLMPLLAERTAPRDRSEEEVFGYRRALDWIHAKHSSISIDADTICHLHYLSQSGFSGDAGDWKKRNNEIIELLPNGTRVVRFVPVSPENTPEAMQQLCLGYRHVTEQQLLPDLLAVASFVLDFLCIHPFRDGNGRVSRLLTLLLLCQHNYLVGSFVSLERIIEVTKEGYYQALKDSSKNWHEGNHEVSYFWNYFLGVVRDAYGELAERVKVREGQSRGKSELLKQVILSQRDTFSLADIKSQVETSSPQLIKKVFAELKNSGLLELSGQGRGARWKVRRS